MTLIRDREVVKVDKSDNGKGYLLRDMLLEGELLGGILSYMSIITLEPGCAIGPHLHSEENEVYYIIEGTGVYYDNGEEYEVQAGDLVVCDLGQSHGLENTGDTTMRFVAVMQEPRE